MVRPVTSTYCGVMMSSTRGGSMFEIELLKLLFIIGDIDRSRFMSPRVFGKRKKKTFTVTEHNHNNNLSGLLSRVKNTNVFIRRKCRTSL